MTSKFFLAALLLPLAACTKPPAERATASVLHMLRHQLGPGAQPDSASLKVYPFSKTQMRYFTSAEIVYGDGHLVTYEVQPGPAGTPRPGRRATFVPQNDSAIFFQPLQHQAEFARQYGVAAPSRP